MQIIRPSIEIIDFPSKQEIFGKLETAARVCYQSDGRTKICPECEGTGQTLEMGKLYDVIEKDCPDCEGLGTLTGKALIEKILISGHHSVLEHVNITVRIICDRGVTHEFVRHRIGLAYCLSGDTLIYGYTNTSGRLSAPWKLSDLHRAFAAGEINPETTLLRSVDERGILVPNKIVNVVFSGRQKTYTVLTRSGRKVRATAKHRFLRTDGQYVPLGELSAGDRIFANGVPALENPEYLHKRFITDNLTRKDLAKEIGCCESYLYKAFCKFKIRKPWSNRPNRGAGRGKPGMFTDHQKREIAERMLGSGNHRYKGDEIGTTGAYIRTLRSHPLTTESTCWGCGTKERLQRHHFDKNPKNNTPNNVDFVCIHCHRGIHFPNKLTVFSDEILSITPYGEEDTYDIEMAHPHHNFVADGLVVHNSQESTRFCNYFKDAFGNEIKVIGPCFWEEDDPKYQVWRQAMEAAEAAYLQLIEMGAKPQEARAVLPNSLKTEMVITGNVRAWRHFFQLRTAGAAHPQMREIACMLQQEFQARVPVLFDTPEKE